MDEDNLKLAERIVQRCAVLVLRMLKYTPEHMHCLANIYGATAPPNTGILAIQSTSANLKVPVPRPCLCGLIPFSSIRDCFAYIT